MVGLGSAGGRDWRAVGAAAAHFLGRRLTTLRGVWNIFSCCHECVVLLEGTIFQFVAGVGVAIDLRRISLTSTAGSDLLSFPVPFGERGIAVFVAMGGVVEEIL